ncbi:MAG: hypothetical protein WC055_01895 [Melioribacteraceae bacterium]
MKKEPQTLSELIHILEAYNEQNTRFQIPADIFSHSKTVVPLRAAINRLTEFEKYWNKQEVNTLFFIWHTENLKVWNDILYEFEFKEVVKISAENDKIKEFSRQIDSTGD